MATTAAEAKKAEEAAEAKKAEEAARPAPDPAGDEVKPKAKVKLAHPAPSEYEGLPQGINGGPATIDNPEAV